MLAARAPSSHNSSGRKGGNGASVRAIALGITAAIHLVAAAVAAFAIDWRQPGSHHSAPRRLVTFAVPNPQARHDQPAPASRHARTEVIAIPSSLTARRAIATVALPLPAPPEPVAVPAIDAGASSEIGNLQDIALSYRRAIMARLAAQRSYPAAPLRKGWQGSGSLLFHIDREGHLLGTVVVVGTGHGLLDDAAQAMVARAAPFPPIPGALPDELAITLPITFLIDGHAQQAAQ